MKPRAPLAPLRARLLRWYAASHRDLPWRRTRDPYRVWVSEVMLQQTRVETVLPYYRRFLERFPDVATLAGAPLDDVLAAWSGLGYYRRARHLHAAADTLVREHAGSVPRSLEAVRALPGIGRSTAGAIVSIAYGERAPILDGNVRRVLARLFAVRGDAGSRAVESRLWQLSSELVDCDEAGELNQALMELGATVCLPLAAARCADCPLRDECRARAEDRVATLPELAKQAPPLTQTWAVAAARDGGRYLLRRRDAGGLMSGLFELPTCELAEPDAGDPARRRAALARWLRDELGLEAQIGAELMSHRHAISNRVVTERVHAAVAVAADGPSLRWLAPDAIDRLAVTTATRKILARLEPDGAAAPLFARATAAAPAAAALTRAAAARRPARSPPRPRGSGR